MPHQFQASQWTPFPVELVFAFFANPANLPHLMPRSRQARFESSRVVAPPQRPVAADPALRFQSPAAGVGSEMVVSFRPVAWLPVRMEWLARITEFAWNSHFCDEQLRGPFASWKHCHRVAAELRDGVSGTLVTDELAYDMPLEPLGSLGNAILIRRQLAQTFAYRRQRLDEILPVVARQAIRRK